MKPKSRTNKTSFLLRSLFFCLACSSYILAFPIFSFSGIGFLSLITLCFFLLWMENLNLGQIALGGGIAGALIHLALTPWLGNYHPFALALSLLAGAVRFILLFYALHLVSRARPWLRALASVFIISCVPILCSWGFLAFPYATLPYAMSSSRFAFFLASIGGTSLVTLAIACVNYGIYKAVRSSCRLSGKLWLVPLLLIGLAFLIPVRGYRTSTHEPAVREINAKRGKNVGTIRVALIQPNLAQKQNGPSEYQAMFLALRKLSEKAEEYQPDLILWHETAIVPALAWHLKYRPQRETYEFAKEVQEYLLSCPAAVLLGTSWVAESDAARSSDFNSAILYDGGSVSDVYSKIKLVPFSEYFPWSKEAPALNRWLVSRFGSFRAPGTQKTVFYARGSSFAAHICFEDSFAAYFGSFPELDFFTVLTQDSWAKSGSMQKQHAIMSKFRAAETGSVVLRATNTGDTMAIEPNGHVSAALKAFTSDFLVVDIIKGANKKTVFELWGRHLSTFVLIVSFCLLALILFDCLHAKRKTGSNFG